MIIKNIKVKSFGGLKNKEVNFSEGINIISGENEVGKTTLQNFIRAFLYGMSTKRSKSIRDNIRIRYMSFSGERASGEMTLDNEGEEVLIIRSFGKSKKEDNVKVVDYLTGDTLSELSHDEPAKTIMNINSETFDNTIFIKSLGTFLNSSKDDEIMHKLTSSLESGEEGVSYFKALGKLDAIKKALTTVRGNGKLDLLKNRKIEILEEKENFFKASNDNLEDEVKIINLKKDIGEVRLKLKKLEVLKKHLKKMKLQKEYKDILQYLKKSEELKNKAKVLDGELEWEEGIIDKEKIDGLKEESAVLISFYNLAESKIDEGQEIEKEKIEVEQRLEEFSKIIELGEDLENKLLKIVRETNQYEAKYLVYEENNKELLDLQNRLNSIKASLGKYIELENYEQEIKNLLSEYENKLFQLKGKVLDRKIVNSPDELKGLKFVRNIYFIFIALGVLMSIGLTIYNKPYSIFPILISIVFLILNFGNSKKLDNLEKQNKEKEEIDNLEKSIKQTEETLIGYGKVLGIHSYEEFGLALSEYNSYKEEIKTLVRMIEERERRLKLYDIEEMNKIKAENEKIISRILSYTNAVNIEELLDKIKELSTIKARHEIVMHKWKNFNDSYEKLKEDIEKRENLLNAKLKLLRLDNVPLYNLADELERLSEKLSEKDKIILALNGVDETYKALLKDRDLEYMREELKEMLSDTMEYSYENEEDVEEEIKISQNKLLEHEKQLKDVENSAANRFLGIRSLIAIEADLQEVKDKIVEYENELRALEIGKELLQEAFKELQKNVGPILNERVSFYFNKLTNGKYTEVKVGNEYELLVRDINENIIKGEYLSNGAWDQVYLSLRLAFVDMLFGDKKVPLIFDDAFIQYDDKRLNSTLDVIKSISERRQVILFSCHNREIDILRERANIIRL